MIYYAKIAPKAAPDDVRDIFLAHDAEPNSIFIDQSAAPKSAEGIYQAIKAHIKKTSKTLVVDTISSLGKTSREISNELNWFKENQIKLIILDIPSTMMETASCIDTLSELYSSLASVEIENVKVSQKEGILAARKINKTLGRKRIPYPDNWAEAYSLWVQKQITVTEFMQMTGLKKGTLYNLIKQYKEQGLVEKNA